jgi:hypothetical protein
MAWYGGPTEQGRQYIMTYDLEILQEHVGHNMKGDFKK